ncbi:MAG: cell wall-binding repeat-containing protein, partial [Acidimicrobiales bacterium]
MTSIVGVLRKAAEGRHLRLPRLRRLRRGVLVGVGLGLGVGALGLGAGLLAPEVLAAPAATGGPAIPAVGATSSNITFFRQAGADRYATAAAIAADTFGNSAPTVLLTTGTNYPDALAAAYLAGTESGGAPILLTKPTSLDPATSAALVSLHASKVVIIGGTGAVSMAVQTALAANYQVSRIAGANRYDTAKLVDTQPGEQVGTDAAGQPSAVLVSGATYADALSASALGYARHLPVVLTDPAVLSPQAVDVLSADHIAHVVQVGGSGAIAPSVTQAVRSMGISVDEVAGTDRSATSNLLAADEVANYGFSLEHFDLASGTDFPDSLAGGPHAGGEAAPMLLSTGASSPGSAPAWAAAHCSSLTSGDIFGGTGALGASTAQLVGLACPSNGSISLMTGIGPVVQGSLTASTGSTAAGSSTASTGHLVPGPSGGSTTALTASVAICGP